MATENIKNRKIYRICTDAANKVWDRINFLTNATSVDANDGDNLETKVGAIKGITTSTSVTEEGYVADAKTVSGLSDSLQNINFYVGSDEQLHFVDNNGTDTVLDFSSGASEGTFSLTVGGSASRTNNNVACTATIGGTSTFLINFDTKTVTISSQGIYVHVSAKDSGGENKTASKTATHTCSVA